MNGRAVIDRLNRAQHALWFKVAASALVVALAATVVVTYVVRVQALRAQTRLEVRENAENAVAAPAESASAEEKARYQKYQAQRQQEKTAAEATAKALNRMLASQTDPTAVAVAAAGLTGLALGVIWLGQGLTVLGVLVVLGVVSGPLVYYGFYYDHPRVRDAGLFVAALGALTVSFVVLMELLRTALSWPNPVLAIARNVVNEAVRIKVSLVFIVLLLFALAALPGMLDEGAPLRYRVQNFLQYGTGGSFWIIAILVIVLAVSSVAFEQRDRVIWQTMTKPVAAWQYLLGKWLGVVGVGAVLLAVSTSGVFLFTEYLRDQRAVGEVRPYQPADESLLITPDRLVLESQVLSARRSITPRVEGLSDEEIDREVERRVEKARRTVGSGEEFQDTPELRSKLRSEYVEEYGKQVMSLGPAQSKQFEFVGLGEVKASGSPLTLRYKVDVGANDPKVVHRITFVLDNVEPIVQEVPLGQMMTIDVSPASIDADGTLGVRVINGDIRGYVAGRPEAEWANQVTMTFPPGGFGVFYAVGSYHANFLRVVGVLWLKLAFLAMVGVCAATFLSFSVASLVAFGTFLAAESAKYLFDSLEYYASRDAKGNIDLFKVLVRAVAVPISRAFHSYASLRPTANLVEGLVVSWGTVARATLVLGLTAAVLYALAIMVFRRRELAMYSGH